MPDDPATVVLEFVEAFVSAWPSGDATPIAAMFSEDAVYLNGPHEPVHGRAAIEATISGFMAMGGEVTVDMVNLLADERIVMTERIDHFVLAGQTYSLPVMGVFEVDDGRITAWRDYFDLNEFTSLFDSDAVDGSRLLDSGGKLQSHFSAATRQRIERLKARAMGPRG